jgi:hypothetical protein
MAAGVDRRRPIYASQQGSLWEGINGHLSRGGDFDKRKAFVDTYTLPTGTFGLQGINTKLTVFGGTEAATGALPAGVEYQALIHPSAETMTAILWSELYDGKIYVIAEYADGSIMHFYDGSLVTDWFEGVVKPWMTSFNDVALHFASLMKQDMPGYSTSVSGSVLTIKGPVGVDFSITASSVNGGLVDDQVITLATTQASSTGGTEVLASGSFAVTRPLVSYAGDYYFGYDYSYIESTYISVLVNGVEILAGSALYLTGNLSTTDIADAIAASINSKVSVPDYTATSSGNVVTIKALPGTGAGPNGFTVMPGSTAPGTNGVVITFGSITNMAGGSAGTTNQPKIVTATFSGTAETEDTFALTIAGTLVGYKAGNPPYVGTIALTYESKMYVLAESLMNYSKVNDATKWNSDNDTGAGYENIQNHAAGSETLTGIAVFQGNIAVFSPKSIQLWHVEADDDNNALLQTLKRTGTRSPGSIQSFGDIDVFYLDNGVRSLRSRDQTQLVSVNDVGTLVDTLVQTWLASMTAAEIALIRSIIEPEDGRYWLAINDRILVFSYFPGSKVSGWTWYEPGFIPEWFADPGDKTGAYVRSGNKIYKYGGSDNATYDSCAVTCWLPFMDAEKPGHRKNWYGFDLLGVNTWNVKLLTDPEALDRFIQVGDVTGYTVLDDNIGALTECVSLSPKLVCTSAGAASVSSMILHYHPVETGDSG